MNTTLELIQKIKEVKDRRELNCVIYELVCRIYVPFSGINFDDLLYKYGYRPINYNELIFSEEETKTR